MCNFNIKKNEYLTKEKIEIEITDHSNRIDYFLFNLIYIK